MQCDGAGKYADLFDAEFFLDFADECGDVGVALDSEFMCDSHSQSGKEFSERIEPWNDDNIQLVISHMPNSRARDCIGGISVRNRSFSRNIAHSGKTSRRRGNRSAGNGCNRGLCCA